MISTAHALVGHYSVGLVCLFFGVAILASYTTLNLGHRISVSTGWRYWLWLLGSAVAVGTSIWATHFIATLALEMPIPITSDLLIPGLSIVYAVLAAGGALVLVSRSGLSWLSLGVGGVMLGLAIAWMYYTGMAGTVFEPELLIDKTSATPDLNTPQLALVVALGAGLILMITQAVLRFNQRLIEQRLQAEALAKSEQRFRTLIRDMGVGVMLLNAKAEILISNQAAAQFLHLPISDGTPLIFGQTGVVRQEDGTPFLTANLPVQQAIAQKAPIDDVVIGVSLTEADPICWLLANVDPQINDAGQVERVVCTCSDITIQKQAEDAVRAVANREKTVMRIVQRMRQTLDLETIFAATTQELQQAVGCDRVWIYRFNPDWSGAVVAEHLIDPTAPSTLVATNPSQTLIDRSDCGAREMQNSAFDDGYLQLEDTFLKETQAETYRQDRTYHRVNDIYAEGFDACYLEFLERWQVRAYVIVPIFAGGQLWGLLGIYAHHQPRTWTRHEVKMVLQVGAHLGTAVQQADLLRQTQQQAEALAVAKRAADAANTAKSEFLSSMSHELRTPLNAILGFTQIVYDDPSLDEGHRDLIGIVNRSGNHLLGLINNVLSLAKIEANKITLDENAFDLHHMLQAIDDMLQLKAEARGIRLEMVKPTPLPYRLQADEGKLRQILINLIGNAIKFTAEGGITVRSRLHGDSMSGESSSTKTHWLEISVQDTGVGIAHEELPHLFKPFEQTQSGRRSAEGTGLGLSLSYRFAQLMGGSIIVTSTPGEGSTFTVSLPVGTVRAALASTQTTQQAILGLAPHQPRYRILVADDGAESRLLMRRWLEDAGFEVREASQGQAAVDIWRVWQPHLICLDMRMPVLDGYGVARHVRQLPGGNATVIIAVTASVFEEQRSDCIAAGCNAVLPKPLRRAALLEHIGLSLNLNYQYAEATGPGSARSQAPSPCRDPNARPLTEADFSTLSADWLTQVHRAAQAADDRQVRQLIAQLPAEQQSLAQRLDCLVNDFRLDIIIALTAAPSTSVPL